MKGRGPGSLLARRASDSVSCSLQPPTPETDYPESLTSYPEEDYSPVGSLSEPLPSLTHLCSVHRLFILTVSLTLATRHAPFPHAVTFDK